MPDPTRSRAYLARTKDQEKDVIAVPDGAGRALCISSDKHWTLTREWDELHIIAPLVEAARWGLAESERDFSGVDWKVMYSAMERERDDWRDKAYSASEGMRKATALAEATERSRDAWKARADAAKRDAAVARAEAAEARTTPVVTRADIEEAIRGKTWAANREPNRAGFHRVHIEWATDAVWSLVSGADQAVFVVRESDLPEVAAWAEDPIMVRTRELLDLAYPGEYAWTGAFETCRRIAEAEARLEAGDE